MKYSFIILETKLLNNVIHVFGGLVPTPQTNEGSSMTTFRWYKLSEIRPEKVEILDKP